MIQCEVIVPYGEIGPDILVCYNGAIAGGNFVYAA